MNIHGTLNFIGSIYVINRAPNKFCRKQVYSLYLDEILLRWKIVKPNLSDYSMKMKWSRLLNVPL